MNSIYGSRTPYIGLNKATGILHTTSAINSNWNWVKDLQKIEIGDIHHIEFHQRYVNGGEYRYFIILDGKEVYSVINTDAKQFYNVYVYASNPWNDPCPVYIKNLKINNFL